ncbi:hypothetical protein [Prauserella flavalba]|uniref:Uncharacterized protein n=1 Tax=Prauserella flavalba TaxID=1477506 RepID=A0A318L9S3_9PSEU|nr:hypothetical protein [Prauserella flavalba]PXY17345.1 hypothetical protein BA062_37685 [Prauserella flavalba]
MADSQRTIRIRFDGTAQRLRAAANRVREELRASTSNVTQYNRAVEAAAARVRKAYDAEADATEKLKIAQARLQEVRSAAVVKASALAAAEANVAKATRAVAAAQASGREAAQAYGEAQREAARAMDEARRSSLRARLGIDRIGNVLERARGFVLRFSSSFLKLALAGASLNTLIGLVGGLAGVIASASGALGLLPGIAAAAVAGIAAVKLGAEGIQRQFERLNPTLDKLRARVSRTFYHAMEPAVESLMALLPKLGDGLDDVAIAVSRTAARFTGMLEEARNTKTLNQILGGSARIITNLGRALAPIGEALLDIAAVGGDVFADLTEGAGDAAERFADFIEQARESGRLREWMQEGIDTVREVGAVFGDLWDIVTAVFSALEEGGAGLGGTLGPAIATVKEFVESAEGQEVFRTLGAILEDLSRIVVSLLEPALKLLAPIIGPLGRVVDALANFVEQDLAPALEDLAAIIGPLVGWLLDMMAAADGLGVKVLFAAAALGALVKAAGKLKGVGKVIAGALAWKGSKRDGQRDGRNYVNGAADGAQKASKDKGSKAGKFFGTAMRTASRALLVTWGLDLADTLFPDSVTDAVTGKAMGLGEATELGFSRAFDFVTRQGLWKPVIDGTAMAVGEYEAGWAKMANTARMFGIDLSTIVAFSGQTAREAWNTSAGQIVGDTTTTWSRVASEVQAKGFWASLAAKNAATDAKNGWWSQMAATSSSNATIWDKIARDASAKSRAAAASAKSQSNGLRGGWVNNLNAAATGNNNAWARMVAATQRQGDLNRKTAQNAARQVRGAFSGLSLHSEGSAIMQSLGAGMDSRVGSLIAKAQDIARKIKANKGPIEKDRKLLVPEGIAIMQGLQAGMDAGLTGVLRTAAEVAPAIAARLGGAGVVTRNYLTAEALPVSGGREQATPGNEGAAEPVTEVRVFIGDRELTDIVRTEVTSRDRTTRRLLSQGVGAAR